MLDSDTKRRIDSARQILVGKVPDPKGQVEQITTALIYKFMDDMDKEAEELGGEAKFFTGEHEKYAWSRLMDVRLGGQARLNLYAEALDNLWKNKNLPPLFQQIFKSSFLPFRDPETLNLFLKEINGFVYDHSERLGDAYEYLLNVLGTQGDAGQFRTPRHIIDFIVEAVDPSKDDTILDPACGTAGFLISAYKHILKENTKQKSGDALTPDEKRALMGRFTGYDISPDMVRLSLVNMYLHGFPLPNIAEYDTLGQEERWDDSFNVVLANPPFMTPKGGVMPHKRFSVQAKRSEVLFVDYIADHLTPNGRAGVIVPEGIIFQSGNAYKQLRKMLVENYLYAVVSLPAGSFNPYSGVKTSVLLMDKNIAKRSREIAFVKVGNDGFDLGATKRPIAQNDLPQALEILKAWKEGEKNKSPLAVFVEKTRIAESGDFNLSGDRYRAVTYYSNARWPMVKLKELEDSEDITLGRGQVISKIDIENDPGSYPVYSSSAKGDGQFGRYGKFMFDEELLTWSVDGGGRFFYRPRHKFSVTNVSGWMRINNKQKIDARYLFYVLDFSWKDKTFDYSAKAHPSVIREVYQIPLPPLEVQQKIVEELDGYQKIISGARQIVENWKPRIEVEEGWERVRLGEVCEKITDGTHQTPTYSDSGFIFLSSKNVTSGEIDWGDVKYIPKELHKHLSKRVTPKLGDVLLAKSGTTGVAALVDKDVEFDIYESLALFRPIPKLDSRFLLHLLNSEYVAKQFEQRIKGVGIRHLHLNELAQVDIPLPPLEIQKQIVEKVEAERVLVEAAKKLIEIYEGKMRERVGRVWGNIPIHNEQ